jgi:hypothetical protein
MATRIRKRTTIVASPKIDPVVRQAISDLSRNTEDNDILADPGKNIILQANDPNVKTMRLQGNTSYFCGYQGYTIGGRPSTLEAQNNHVLWNSIRIIGAKGASINRSLSETSGNGVFEIGYLENRRPGITGNSFVLIEDVSFYVPVLVRANYVTFRNCFFNGGSSFTSLTLNCCNGVMVDGCVFGNTVRAVLVGGSGFPWVEPGEILGPFYYSPNTFLNCSRTTFDYGPNVGIEAISSMNLTVIGCNFEETPGFVIPHIGYDFRAQDMKYVNFPMGANKGVIVT